jgi:hypothetical protein
MPRTASATGSSSIVALHQHGETAAVMRARPGPRRPARRVVQQARQLGESRRRMAPRRRRLARGQADLAQRQGRSGSTLLHQQQHALALASREMLGHGHRRRRRRLAPQPAGGWADVAQHGTTERAMPVGAEIILDELAHLAPPLADQGDAARRRRSAPRASMESSVDSPTPEPANSPQAAGRRRQVAKASSARTPRSMPRAPAGRGCRHWPAAP